MAGEREDPVSGFQREIGRARDLSSDAFFGWFNNDPCVETAFVTGAWDFKVHFAEPLAPYLPRPADLCALEIGYGGGRLLANAALHFGRAVGVDVHDNADMVAAALRDRGLRNVELLRTAGDRLPVPEASVDVVYSFIVLQHVQHVAVFDRYLEETARVLRPGGMALLYFGRFSRFSADTASRTRYALDLVADALTLVRGYREISDAAVNSTNLRVHPAYAVAKAHRAGLRPRRLLVSRRQGPGGRLRYGRQHGLLAQRR